MPGERIEAAKLAELAAAGERLTLSIDPAELTRLSVLLAEDSEGGRLDARLQFEEGPEGFPRVRLEIAGELGLRCQRCLGTIVWPVALDTRLTVLRDEREAEQLAEPFDSVAMDSGALMLETVIEDEILAALPIAPMHGPGQGCTGVDGSPEGLEKQAGQTYRPFEALARLVAGGDGGD